MSKRDNTLNLQKKLIGHVLIRKGPDTWEVPVCFVYGNKDDKNEMVMMLQDKSDSGTQIQITIEKEQKV